MFTNLTVSVICVSAVLLGSAGYVPNLKSLYNHLSDFRQVPCSYGQSNCLLISTNSKVLTIQDKDNCVLKRNLT